MSPAPTNWQDELHALMVELGPGLYFADVRHDPWCAFLAGRGPCNCLPDISVKRIEVKDEPDSLGPEVSK
jgi:hypothetical protein